MHRTHNDSELLKIDIVGVSVTALRLDAQIELITLWAKQGLSKVVYLANVHMLMESRTNLNLKNALAGADLVAPDGMPLVWMMRLLGEKTQNRVAGMDVFVKLCKRCVDEKISIYLLGSTQAILDEMEHRLRQDFSGIKIAGTESPPFRPLSETDYSQTIRNINESRASVTFVSLGCPKQEQWIANHVDKIDSVMVGVGGVFPVYAGVQKHAPRWVRESGLEWVYRLSQEPKRLTRRYLTTIPPFIFLASKQLMTFKVPRLSLLTSQSP
ncbi:MAG: WecB/TagA/CpsF family glycosyltransferase [Cyanobacteria bacterium P01_D01_bin.56]